MNPRARTFAGKPGSFVSARQRASGCGYEIGRIGDEQATADRLALLLGVPVGAHDDRTRTSGRLHRQRPADNEGAARPQAPQRWICEQRRQ